MKIVLIGHGKLPIPPNGWGGVERTIHDSRLHLQALGHEVEILNVPHRRVLLSLLARTLTKGRADVIWCHNERPVPVLAKFKPLICRYLVETCHSPNAMPDPDPAAEPPIPLIQAAKSPAHLSIHPALSQAFLSLNPTCKVIPFKIGVDVDRFRFGEVGNGKAICLGRISLRKRQRLIANELASKHIHIDFVGPESPNLPADERVSDLASYQGAWTGEEVRERLTDYSVLVLWSSGEVQPGVVVEALAAGLDVVVSPDACTNLDLDQPFIHPVESIESLAETTRRAILENASRRHEIRQYAQENWDWSSIFQTVSDGFIHQLAADHEKSPALGTQS